MIYDKPAAFNNLGLSYYKLKMYQQAQDNFLKAIHSSDNPAQFLNNLAL